MFLNEVIFIFQNGTKDASYRQNNLVMKRNINQELPSSNPK